MTGVYATHRPPYRQSAMGPPVGCDCLVVRAENFFGKFFLLPYANGFWSIVCGLDDVWQKRNAIVQSAI
jgi:hypothetical protein